jgi:hypothetical protein
MQQELAPLQGIRMARDFFRFAYGIGTPISFGLGVQIRYAEYDGFTG